MKNKQTKVKSVSSHVFVIFIIINIMMLIASIYTIYFSSLPIFSEHRINNDVLIFWGGIKNIILLSGLWIFIDVMFSIFFYIKSKVD